MEESRAVLLGNPVSRGIVLARAYVYEPLMLTVTDGYFEAGKENEYVGAFENVVFRAKAELQKLSDKKAEAAGIFAAQSVLLEDEGLLREIHTAIVEERMYPDRAIAHVISQFAEEIGNVQDPLIAARAADLYDVRNRLLRIYQGKEEQNLSDFSEDVIIIAKELLPSDTATLDRRHVKGIITERGGENSHTAILARSYQIPAILGVAEVMKQIPNGALVVMDALNGEVIVNPSKEEQIRFQENQQSYLQKRGEAAQYACKPGRTRDGHEIQIGMNIDGAEFDVPEEDYDFVGLFRTEFLYMESVALPTEEEQLLVYKRVLDNAKGKMVTLRTLDIGGDKTLPYMELPKEDNPFLGKRALRFCLAESELFMTQLRAALRASAYGPLQLMFPMVGSMEDIYRAKEYVKSAMEQLEAEGIPYDKDIKLGIMIEVPAIALIADLAAEEVDFASVGSNDLTQYICAADRMNPEITTYYQNYSPAMLRLLCSIADAFAEKGKPLSLCGEMAGNPEAAVLLAGLGITKLSMSPSRIPGVKAALAQITMEDARELAERCKYAKTEKEVREYLKI